VSRSAHTGSEWTVTGQLIVLDSGMPHQWFAEKPSIPFAQEHTPHPRLGAMRGIHFAMLTSLGCVFV
jgi:hypothetical protein